MINFLQDNWLCMCARDVLADEILRLRKAIRYHRDQRGDDRCWLDDQKLYEVLPEHPVVDATLPPEEEFIDNCRQFHRCRQAVHFKNVDELYLKVCDVVSTH